MGNAIRIGVGRMRHIELKYLWLKDTLRWKSELNTSLARVASADNTADLGTKHLSRKDMETHMQAMNVTSSKMIGAVVLCQNKSAHIA